MYIFNFREIGDDTLALQYINAALKINKRDAKVFIQLINNVAYTAMYKQQTNHEKLIWTNTVSP